MVRQLTLSQNAKSHKGFTTARGLPPTWTSGHRAMYAAYHQHEITSVSWPLRDIVGNFELYLAALPLHGVQWHVQRLFRIAPPRCRDQCLREFARRRMKLNRYVMLMLMNGCSMRGLASSIKWIESTLDEFWDQAGYGALWFMTGLPRMPRTPGESTYLWNDYIGRYYRPLVDSFCRVVHQSFERDVPFEFWSATYVELLGFRDRDTSDKRSLFSQKKKLKPAAEPAPEPTPEPTEKPVMVEQEEEEEEDTLDNDGMVDAAEEVAEPFDGDFEGE